MWSDDGRGHAAIGMMLATAPASGGQGMLRTSLAVITVLLVAFAYLIVAPIKIEGGSGGQARVFSVVP